MFNKKAQIGETMTWVVATIVIVVVLSFSILLSINIFKDKKFEVEKETDLLAVKSLTGYLLTEDSNGKKVFANLQEAKNLEGERGELAKKIFKVYTNDFGIIWLGFVYPDKTIGYWKKNDFFQKPRIKKGGDVGLGYKQFIIEKIKLTDEKSIELMMEKID